MKNRLVAQLSHYGIGWIDDGYDASQLSGGRISPRELATSLVTSSPLVIELLNLRDYHDVDFGGNEYSVYGKFDKFVRCVIREVRSRNHTQCSTVHLLRMLIRITPEEVDYVLQRLREVFRTRHPLGNELIAAELQHPENQDDPNIYESLLRQAKATPFEAKLIKRKLDRYLAHRFYPYNRVQRQRWMQEHESGMREHPRFSPVDGFLVHRELGLEIESP